MLNQFGEYVNELSMWRRKKDDVVAVGIISDNDNVKEDDGGICSNDKESTRIESSSMTMNVYSFFAFGP